MTPAFFSLSFPGAHPPGTSKEHFNNVPDLELNPIRSKIVRAFFDNRWAFSRGGSVSSGERVALVTNVSQPPRARRSPGAGAGQRRGLCLVGAVSTGLSDTVLGSYLGDGWLASSL